MKPYKHKTMNSGFTLIELTISIFIIATIISALIVLNNFVFEQQKYTINTYISVDTVNRNVEKMVKELRNSRSSENGAYALETLNDQEIAFYSNADNDPQIEKIRYFLDSQSLYKGVTNPVNYPVEYPQDQEVVNLIAENISNNQSPLFYYYNSNWPQDTENNPLSISQRLTQTRIIKISLVINTQGKSENSQYQIESYSQIRTLKDNL